MRTLSIVLLAATLAGCMSQPMTPEQRAFLMQAYQAQQAVNAQNAATMRAGMQQNQSTNCTSNVNGNTVYTTCR